MFCVIFCSLIPLHSNLIPLLSILTSTIVGNRVLYPGRYKISFETGGEAEVPISTIITVLGSAPVILGNYPHVLGNHPATVLTAK